MARKRKGYYFKANVKPVVCSSTYRANVNPACDTDFNVKLACTTSYNVKQTSKEVYHASVVCGIHNNVKHTPASDAGQTNVKQVCESDPNVKLLGFNNVSDHGLNASLHASVGEDLYQDLPNRAQEVSDATAKAISSHGVSVDINVPDIRFYQQPINAAKVVSAPGTEGKCPDIAVENSAVLTSVNLDKGNIKMKMIQKANSAQFMTSIMQVWKISLLIPSCMQINSSCFKVMAKSTEIYNAWRCQSDFDFGFVPIGE